MDIYVASRYIVALSFSTLVFLMRLSLKGDYLSRATIFSRSTFFKPRLTVLVTMKISKNPISKQFTNFQVTIPIAAQKGLIMWFSNFCRNVQKYNFFHLTLTMNPEFGDFHITFHAYFMWKFTFQSLSIAEFRNFWIIQNSSIN